MAKTIKGQLNDKIIQLVERYKKEGTVTEAYVKTSLKVGVSIPTVILVYKKHITNQ